ncbi:hypothetical protein F4775DRAFT_600186 [Biscogniauxia sp. FL1348]|nr:hypothetical protein F4775DRAFT_600186 [Biscogniauxia sp. FL1348]
MASTQIYPPQDEKPPSLPRLGLNAAMTSQQPPPPGHSPSPPPDSPPNDKGGSPKPYDPANESHHRRLISHNEWVQFCQGVGVLKDHESNEVVRITNRCWPPSGFKDGLYQDVLYEKSKFSYWFHIVNAVQWILMLSQLALGATLTALGSLPKGDGPMITIIAAISTCVSGVLALIHNSGLPYRYRSDRNEFYKLEEHLKSIIDTGLVPADQNIHEVLADCFDMFRSARQTVQDNIPASYKAGAASKAPPPTTVSGAPQKPPPGKK